MIQTNQIKRVTADPAPIHRNSGASSEVLKHLLSLDEGEAIEITSDSEKEHKAAQRNINVMMKKLSKIHPEYSFVTRTVSADNDGIVLGVYRIEDKAA